MVVRKIGVVGLGYVGLPVAIEFGKRNRVVGFDIDQQRVNHLQEGVDTTLQVREFDLQRSTVEFTACPSYLEDCDFIIVTVPTPIDEDCRPDLGPLISASRIIGNNITKGTIIVYESTVYPGVTEEVCIPVLEDASNLEAGHDFFVGYSPERINPGDEEHTFSKIKKIVSGQTPEIADKIAAVYNSVVDAGVYIASSIQTAESAKLVENIQRDINIALMNELSIFFHKVGVNTAEVLQCAATKWNFTPYYPGLVGGHCIGVDPYYLTHRAEKKGYYPEFILSARRRNNTMPQYIVQSMVTLMVNERINPNDTKVSVLGVTFKENIPDIRNSKVFEIIKLLQQLKIQVHVSDPFANIAHVYKETDLELTPFEQLAPADIVIIAVPHRTYLDMKRQCYSKLFKDGRGLLMDIRGKVNQAHLPDGTAYWSL